ncbi:MAG TPA: nucleoside kinase, partial [Synergistaceae bacterium]|nr:nucleoside kinase [Synergistaceae bacterium]
RPQVTVHPPGHHLEGRREVVAWRVNRYLRSLDWIIDEDATVELVDASSFEGMEVYRRTLSFLLVLACRQALGCQISIRHSISNAYYCELSCGPASADQVARIRQALRDLVDQNIPIRRSVVSLDKARRIFEAQGNDDKARLLQWAVQDPVELYSCQGRFGFYYAPLAPSSGAVPLFDLISYAPGMVLRFPTIHSPFSLPDFQATPRLVDVFREYGEWLDILDVGTMASLHEQVAEDKTVDIIMVSEAFHARRLALVSEEIVRRKSVRLVCMAGPSASGKTTASRRLRVQLQLSGLHPVALSLDEYFVDRERTPRDEEGQYDFEDINALDLELLNSHLQRLLAGDEVQLPRFDFLLGKRTPGRKLRLRPKDILIIEGIHGLNDRLTEAVPEDLKYGIFVSPLTGVSLDRHTRTSTTDNRFLRRMVRDHRTRGKSPENTILQWPSVTRGAFKHIFPFQDRADALFNTVLVYELSVLRGYAEPLLRTVPESSLAFGEAQRLLSMLRFVPVIPADNVPNTSILREFIGGSCFGD